MHERSQPTFLAVGIKPANEPMQLIDLRWVSSARDTISLMRFVDVDLILAGKRIPDMDVWTLMQRIRSAWPGQRWALCDNTITPQDEIQARSLGAIVVMDGNLSCSRLYELASSLRARSPAPIHNEMLERELT